MKRMRTCRRYLWTAVATLILMVLAGCDDAPGVDVPAKVPTGTWAGQAGQVDATLDVRADSFTLTIVERPIIPSSISNRSLATASGDGVAWVVLFGTVNVDGDTITLRITGVELDGTELEGAPLARYTRCTIQATEEEDFAEQVMDAVVACLNDAGDLTVVTTVTVSPSPVEDDPVDALAGSWTYQIPGLASTLRFSEGALVWYVESETESCREGPEGRTCVPAGTQMYTVTLAIEFSENVITPIKVTEVSVSTPGGTVHCDPNSSNLEEGCDGLLGGIESAMAPLRYVVSADGSRLSIRGLLALLGGLDAAALVLYFTRS